MKRTPEDQQIAYRMAPGVISRSGFLGTDRRPYTDIIAADTAEVERLGLTHERIAAALEDVRQRAAAKFGTPVPINDRATASYTEAKGVIASPFSGEGVYNKGEVELVDNTGGNTWRFTPLSIHLIAAHGFYQGRGSRYRLEPAEIADLLDIQPAGE